MFFFLNLVTQELNFILYKYNESVRTADRATVPNYHIGFFPVVILALLL